MCRHSIIEDVGVYMKRKHNISPKAVEILRELESLNKKIRVLRQKREIARQKGDSSGESRHAMREKSLFFDKILPLRKAFMSEMANPTSGFDTDVDCHFDAANHERKVN